MAKKYCFAYTLAEIVMVMLIIAVIVAVSIKVTKAKLDNIISYTYYSAYNSIRKVTAEMLADFDIKNDDYIMTLFAQPVYADSDDCFYSISAGDIKYCWNYSYVDSCQVHNFDCQAHIGQYGITSAMCDVGKAIPYGLYVTKGNLSTSTNLSVILKKLVEDSLVPSGQYVFVMTRDSLCTYYWGSGEFNDLMACHDTDHAQPCGWGALTYFISIEEQEQEPIPPVCEQPSKADKEIQYCRGKEFDATPEICSWKNIPLGLLNVMMVINGIMLRLIVSVNPHQEQFPGKVKISANFLRLIQIRVPEQLIVTVMQYLKEQMILVL